MKLERRPVRGDDIANTLHLGDCIDIMDTFPDSCIDLILCDLPYGMTANKWDSVIPINQVSYAFRRLISPRGNIALFSQGLFTARLMLSSMEDMFRYKMVWVKTFGTGFMNVEKMPMRKYEDICVFGFSDSLFNKIMSPGKPWKTGMASNKNKSGVYGCFRGEKRTLENESGDRVPIDVLYFKSVHISKKGRHPTEKPLDLCRHLVKMYSNENGIVLDATMGSGTIPLAAKMERRRYIGIEKDEHWFEHAKKRIENAPVELI